ncbi:MAG: porin [Pseudomonadota bacterium]
MRKVMLAAAVAMASGSASAATIYEDGGFQYKVNGDIQVQLRQKAGDDNNPDIEFDDVELKNYVSYDLNDSMKAFGRVDFGFKDAAEDKQSGSSLEEAYLGMAFGSTSVSFGKMDTAGDEFGVTEAIEANTDEDRFDAVGATSGDDVVRLDADLDALYLAASYELESEGNSSENGEYFDLFVSTEFSGLALGAAFQNWDEAVSSGDESVDTWGVSAAYDAGFATLAMDYSESDSNIDTSANNADQYNLAAKFAAASTTDIAVGMTETSYDALLGLDDVTEYYANVTYKFPSYSNVSVFAEISDTDEDNVDMGYLAGMRVKF